MKNKKILLIMGMIAFMLILGVGYAVVSSVELTFKGSAEGIADAEVNVVIENVVDSPANQDRITHTNSSHGDVFTIKDMILGETVTMVYTIKNNETDVAVNLVEAVELSNSNTEYFSANYVIANPQISAGGTTTVTVTVEMIKTPVLAENNKADFEFKLNANPVNNKTN